MFGRVRKPVGLMTPPASDEPRLRGLRLSRPPSGSREGGGSFKKTVALLYRVRTIATDRANSFPACGRLLRHTRLFRRRNSNKSFPRLRQICARQPANDKIRILTASSLQTETEFKLKSAEHLSCCCLTCRSLMACQSVIRNFLSFFNSSCQ